MSMLSLPSVILMRNYTWQGRPRWFQDEERNGEAWSSIEFIWRNCWDVLFLERDTLTSGKEMAETVQWNFDDLEWFTVCILRSSSSHLTWRIMCIAVLRHMVWLLTSNAVRSKMPIFAIDGKCITNCCFGCTFLRRFYRRLKTLKSWWDKEREGQIIALSRFLRKTRQLGMQTRKQCLPILPEMDDIKDRADGTTVLEVWNSTACKSFSSGYFHKYFLLLSRLISWNELKRSKKCNRFVLLIRHPGPVLKHLLPAHSLFLYQDIYFFAKTRRNGTWKTQAIAIIASVSNDIFVFGI